MSKDREITKDYIKSWLITSQQVKTKRQLLLVEDNAMEEAKKEAKRIRTRVMKITLGKKTMNIGRNNRKHTILRSNNSNNRRRKKSRRNKRKNNNRR